MFFAFFSHIFALHEKKRKSLSLIGNVEANRGVVQGGNRDPAGTDADDTDWTDWLWVQLSDATLVFIKRVSKQNTHAGDFRAFYLIRATSCVYENKFKQYKNKVTDAKTLTFPSINHSSYSLQQGKNQFKHAPWNAKGNIKQTAWRSTWTESYLQTT